MKKGIWAVIVIALIAVIVWLNRPQPVSVRTVQADLGTIEDTVTNTRSGSVMACRRSKLSVSVGGQIDNILVSEGDKVTQGQLLMTLFNDDIVAQHAQAQAHEHSAKLQQTRQCIIAKADEREAQRQQTLLKKGLTSIEQVDLSKAKADASATACQAAQADTEQASAQVQLFKAQLTKTQLVAPFAGTVAEVNGELGEFATPSPPGIPTLPMVDLIDDSCFYVSAPIDEVDAGKIRLGMSATITLDAFRDKPLQGNVRRIAPYVFAMEKQARTVEVEVDITDPLQHPLLVGYSADIDVLIESQQQALKVPTEAIFDGNKIYVLKDGELQLRTVTTGLSNWQQTQILEGVSAGEWVVLSAANADLDDGMAAVAQ